MALPFIDRPPSSDEIKAIQLYFSLYTNGSGSETEEDGSTRIGWRQIERVFKDLYGGVGPENKEVFDVTLGYSSGEGVGLSVKSKTLSEKAFKELEKNGRVYMELANSPAKIWSALNGINLSPRDLDDRSKHSAIGEAMLKAVAEWHAEAVKNFPSLNVGRVLNLQKSVFLCVSMAKPGGSLSRRFKVHSFPMLLPGRLRWEMKTSRCLRGYDADHPDEVMIDWYPNSGGQIKFYPRACNALYSSGEFATLPIPNKSLKELVKDTWPKESAELDLRKELFRHLQD